MVVYDLVSLFNQSCLKLKRSDDITNIFYIKQLFQYFHFCPRIDFKNYVFEVDALTPYLRLEGDYEMDGKVLLLPIKGKGKCNITLGKNYN